MNNKSYKNQALFTPCRNLRARVTSCYNECAKGVTYYKRFFILHVYKLKKWIALRIDGQTKLCDSNTPFLRHTDFSLYSQVLDGFFVS